MFSEEEDLFNTPFPTDDKLFKLSNDGRLMRIDPIDFPNGLNTLIEEVSEGNEGREGMEVSEGSKGSEVSERSKGSEVSNEGKLSELSEESKVNKLSEISKRSEGSKCTIKELFQILDKTKTTTEKNEVKILTERKYQKDNFSMKLFKEIKDMIFNEIKSEYPNIKLHNPDNKIFLHNSNLVDIYIFLHIKFKYLIMMAKVDKEELDKLLYELNVKKPNKRKEITITEKYKYKKYLIRLLEENGYIEKNQEPTIEELTKSIILLLKKKRLKEPNDNKIYKVDEDNLNELYEEYGYKKSYKLQEKNKKYFDVNEKLLEINDLNTTLKDIIIKFYKSGKPFEQFSKTVEKIDDNFKIMKKYKYSLLDIEDNGFIRMVEEDSNLSQEQKDIIKDFTDYVNKRGLTKKEIQNYRNTK